MNGVKIIGIDPGKTGAISIIEGPGEVCVYQMPQTQADLVDFLHDISLQQHDSPSTFRSYKVFLEKAWARPTDGRSSIWKFSGNYHSLTMGLITFAIPYEEVTPASWMKYLSIPSRAYRKDGRKKIWKETMSQFKNRLRNEAVKLYPQVKVFERSGAKAKSKIVVSVADSVLIAEYGRRKREQRD